MRAEIVVVGHRASPLRWVGGETTSCPGEISWPAVGQITSRVVAELESERPDRLDGLRRIGIDESSYRVGEWSLPGSNR